LGSGCFVVEDFEITVQFRNQKKVSHPFPQIEQSQIAVLVACGPGARHECVDASGVDILKVDKIRHQVLFTISEKIPYCVPE
jgi:hypothetical protein